MSVIPNQSWVTPGTALFGTGSGSNDFPTGLTTPSISGLSTINGQLYPPAGMGSNFPSGIFLANNTYFEPILGVVSVTNATNYENFVTGPLSVTDGSKLNVTPGYAQMLGGSTNAGLNFVSPAGVTTLFATWAGPSGANIYNLSTIRNDLTGTGISVAALISTLAVAYPGTVF